MSMDNWSPGEVINALMVPFIILGAGAAIFQVKEPVWRKIFFTLYILAVVADAAYFVRWSLRKPSLIVQRRPSPKPSPKATPSPTRSPTEQKPTPQQSPMPIKEETPPEPSDYPDFVLSTEGTSIRYGYCLDSSFEGRYRHDPNVINVMVDKARFELCKDSQKSRREIQYQVGIGTRADIATKNVSEIKWGPLQKAKITAGADNALSLTPGKLLSIKKSSLSKKTSSLDLSKYGCMIRVFNGRGGTYSLTYNFH